MPAGRAVHARSSLEKLRGGPSSDAPSGGARLMQLAPVATYFLESITMRAVPWTKGTVAKKPSVFHAHE
eukprot:4584580-Pyramimonas_sp.AAC.1